MPKITRLLIHSLLKISFKKNYDSRINLDLDELIEAHATGNWEYCISKHMRLTNKTSFFQLHWQPLELNVNNS